MRAVMDVEDLRENVRGLKSRNEEAGQEFDQLVEGLIVWIERLERRVEELEGAARRHGRIGPR